MSLFYRITSLNSLRIKRNFLLISLLYLAFSPDLNARCLSIKDDLHPCRYPAGDSWCNQQNRPPYAYRDDCQIYQRELPVAIKQGMPYLDARDILIKDGWQTIRMNTRPNGTPVCYRTWNPEHESCQYQEIAACSGTGMGYCIMWFYDGEEKYLWLRTVQGAPPDAIVDMWSKETEPPEIEIHDD